MELTNSGEKLEKYNLNDWALAMKWVILPSAGHKKRKVKIKIAIKRRKKCWWSLKFHMGDLLNVHSLQVSGNISAHRKFTQTTELAWVWAFVKHLISNRGELPSRRKHFWSMSSVQFFRQSWTFSHKNISIKQKHNILLIEILCKTALTLIQTYLKTRVNIFTYQMQLQYILFCWTFNHIEQCSYQK